MTRRIVRNSAIALVALVAGGCGSMGSKQAASTRPSTPPKLSLTKAEGRTGAADALLYPARPTSYVLDGALPDLGSQALVYRWTAHAVDIAEVNRLADAFGIDAAATTTSDGFEVSGADATLMVTVSGGTTQVSYFLGGTNAIDGSGGGSTGGAVTGSVGTGVAPETPSAKPLPADSPDTTVPPTVAPPVDVPSAQEAETIARALLDRAGVLAGQQWETTVTDSGGIAVTCAVGAECPSVPAQVTARDVTFALVLGGVRVSGVAWTVTVGEHRRVQSVYGEWGSAVVLGTYDLRSTADALKRGDTNFGGIEPLAGDVPVKAQDAREPAASVEKPTVIAPAPPVAEPPVDNPPESVPSTTEPPAPEPIVVHITGVSLGIARWNAVDSSENVVDLVPTYVFHTSVDGSTSEIEVLALDPAAIDFAKPIGPPVPVPQPGGVTREPGAVPVPESKGSSSGSAPTVSAKTTPAT